MVNHYQRMTMSNLQIGDKVKYIGKYQDSVYSRFKASIFEVVNVRVINGENVAKVRIENAQDNRYFRFRDYELVKINE